MTARQHHSYTRQLRIAASPKELVEAVTTPEGLTAWWTQAGRKPNATSRLLLRFPDTLELEISRLDDEHVDLLVTDCAWLREWTQTTLSFHVTAHGDDWSRLSFTHVGLTPDLDCAVTCNQGWDHFLDSLRRYLETGAGMPLGSPEDLARRETNTARI